MGPLDITFSLSSVMTGLLWQLLPAQAGLEGSALITFLALLGAGAIAGGFINGLAGFGTALFSLGFWLQIMPPQQAVALVLAMSVLSGIQGLILVRRDIQPRRLGRFAIPAVIGIPIGISLLVVIDSGMLQLIIAVFMMLYGGFFSYRRALPQMTRKTPLLDMLIGFVAGILGGTAGLSGALPTMWCALRPWPKMEQRAVLQPFNMLILGLSLVGLAINGAYTVPTLMLIALIFPLTMLASLAGIWTFRRLSDDGFRRLVIALMFVSGGIVMLRVLLL